MRQRAKYGIDAPRVVRAYIVFGVLLALPALIDLAWLGSSPIPAPWIIGAGARSERVEKSDGHGSMSKTRTRASKVQVPKSALSLFEPVADELRKDRLAPILSVPELILALPIRGHTFYASAMSGSLLSSGTLDSVAKWERRPLFACH